MGIDELVVLKDDRLPWRNSFKVEMVNDYLNSAQEWRNKREVEYSNMGIDIKDAWGVHNETN